MYDVADHIQNHPVQDQAAIAGNLRTPFIVSLVFWSFASSLSLTINLAGFTVHLISPRLSESSPTQAHSREARVNLQVRTADVSPKLLFTVY